MNRQLCRRSLWLAGVYLVAAAAGWAQALNTTTSSNGTVVTYNNTNVTQQVNTYQTELKARMPGGAYLFDQTYSAAFGSATLQAAITQAQGILSQAGATSFTTPTQLSSNQSTTPSTNTVQTGTQVTSFVIGVATLIGPVTIQTGNFGLCQGAALYPTGPGTGLGASVPNYFQYSNCTGGSPQTLTVAPGGQDVDSRATSFETISQTVTTTNTTLTSSVYEIDGVATGAPSVPDASPPALILAILGLAAIGFYASRRLRSYGAASF